MDATGDRELLTRLLRSVSRSFYLTLRALPMAVRPQIGLAYLLARTTDTVADTEVLPLEQRLDALDRLQSRICGLQDAPLDFRPFLGHQARPAERQLLERFEEAIHLLQRCEKADLQRIREVLVTIVSGQRLDLHRFGHRQAGEVRALRTELELDDYTYRVAGCVGEFWTRICRRHLFPEVTLDDEAFLADAVRFGKGLQLVNILRDLPADLRLGRCYLPADRLSACGVAPRDLLEPGWAPRIQPVIDDSLQRAEEHLEAGWNYVKAVPVNCRRVRLACAWPILIGVQTLAGLRSAPMLDPNRPVKIPRSAVRSIVLRSVLLLPMRRRWEAQFQRYRGR